jgi:hypothetical protein
MTDLPFVPPTLRECGKVRTLARSPLRLQPAFRAPCGGGDRSPPASGPVPLALDTDALSRSVHFRCFGREGMTSDAMGLEGVSRRKRPNHALGVKCSHVIFEGRQTQVPWVAALFILASMMNVSALGDQADKKLVGDAVSILLFPVLLHVSIGVPPLAGRVVPTARLRVNHDPIKHSLLDVPAPKLVSHLAPPCAGNSIAVGGNNG